MLPDFLVLGAQRSGTTWLDRLLRAHPGIYLPERRKEVHYFDDYPERGPDWYASFFPPDAERDRWQRVGEITPRYLYDPAVPDRISELVPEVDLIAILRDPVDRAYSQYGLAVRDVAEARSFEDYVAANPELIERGYYARQIARYLDRFPRERLLVLVFERVIGSPTDACDTLASFLGVDRDGFPDAAGAERENPSYRPRHPRLRAAAVRLNLALRDADLDSPFRIARRLGVKRWFGTAGALPPLDPGTRAWLADGYRADRMQLEQLLGFAIPEWLREH